MLTYGIDPGLGKLKQENQSLRISLVFIRRPCLKMQGKEKRLIRK